MKQETIFTVLWADFKELAGVVFAVAATVAVAALAFFGVSWLVGH